MGRVRRHIQINGKKCWTLFDTGARNTYVTEQVASHLVTSKLLKPMRSAIGGGVQKIKMSAVLEAKVEGRPISTHAMIIDELGLDEAGKTIDVLFGALAMQQWGIRPVPDEERLDMTHYTREFVEYSER